MEKRNGSFGFMRRVGLCVGQTKVPFVLFTKIVFKMCVGKKIKTQKRWFWVVLSDCSFLSRHLLFISVSSYLLCRCLGR
jgi:hypothetical protein